MEVGYFAHNLNKTLEVGYSAHNLNKNIGSRIFCSQLQKKLLEAGYSAHNLKGVTGYVR